MQLTAIDLETLDRMEWRDPLRAEIIRRLLADGRSFTEALNLSWAEAERQRHGARRPEAN